MRMQSIDTSPEAERVQIAILRRKGVSNRFRLTALLSRSTLVGSQLYLQQQHPGLTEREAIFLSMEHPLGQSLVSELRQAAEQRQIFPAFSTIELRSAFVPVLNALAHAGIACALTGPFACCLYGMQQALEQIEILADLEKVDTTLLREFLPEAFYVRLADVQDALAAKTAITYYHLPSLFAIRVVFPRTRLDESAMLTRVQRLTLGEGELALPVLAPEDIALLTMERVREREAELARQGRQHQADDIWNELLGVLKVQGPDLDLPFIEQQARRFGLFPMVHRAFEDAGLRE